jgi:hypothetical protein
MANRVNNDVGGLLSVVHFLAPAVGVAVGSTIILETNGLDKQDPPRVPPAPGYYAISVEVAPSDDFTVFTGRGEAVVSVR